MPLLVLSLLAAIGCRTADPNRFDPVVVDADEDGWPEEQDCDERDASIHPGAHEVCNGRDDDCDGHVDLEADDATTFYVDVDGDGYGNPDYWTAACEAPEGWIEDGTDCDDADATTTPETVWYLDGDGDGYGDPEVTAVGCEAPSGHVRDATDCDDGAEAVHPGADEQCDGVDGDCDGAIDEEPADGATFYVDLDGDGFGSDRFVEVACEAPSGFSDDATDCDDLDATVHPGAEEVCDDVDRDCDEDLTAGALGTAADCAASTCADVLVDEPTRTDGTYWLDPDGSGAAEYACDMATDGGGWTRVLRWDRETDGESLEDLQGLFTEDANDMGVLDEETDHVYWADGDGSGDLLAWQAPVGVSNGGEVLLDVHLEADGFEESGVWLYVGTASGEQDLLCEDGTDSATYDADSFAYVPYTCGTSAGGTLRWDTEVQEDAGDVVDSVHLRSLTYGLGEEEGRLYRLSLWVR